MSHGHHGGGHHGGHHPRARSRRARGRRWSWLHRGAFGGGPTPSSPLVTWAQGCLAQVVGSWVPQDGIMGPATQQAIQQFQTQQQLPPTGALDPTTISALQAACSGQQADDGAFPPQVPPPQAAPPPQAPPAQALAPQTHPHKAQTGEIAEGEFDAAPGGLEQEEYPRSGRWVRCQGEIILLGV